MSEERCRYCRRVWLNPQFSESSGSVVAFDGEVERYAGRVEQATFLELADCSGKVCLHKNPGDTMQEFIDKLQKLALEATNFARHLEAQQKGRE